MVLTVVALAELQVRKSLSIGSSVKKRPFSEPQEKTCLSNNENPPKFENSPLPTNGRAEENLKPDNALKARSRITAACVVIAKVVSGLWRAETTRQHPAYIEISEFATPVTKPCQHLDSKAKSEKGDPHLLDLIESLGRI